MGLPTINDNLEQLLNAMAQHPANLGLGVILTWAKMIGLCIALGVGANECFQMMLGRRGLDVMKLLHIVIISFCITFSGGIVSIARQPGETLSKIAYNQANQQNQKVKDKEAEVAEAQDNYLKAVRNHLEQLQENKEAEDATKEGGWGVDDILNKINDFEKSVKNRIKEFALLTEMKLCEWASLIIRYIGEILFQVSYYGILVCHAIFLHILAAFAPLMFAISLSPHYKSAWSQWLSKFISISLWPFVTYICLYYVGYIMEWSLEADISAYKTLLGDLEKDTEGNMQIAAIGMQALGTTCMYVVGLLVGVRAIAFVPEVASWLIPGGVSSSAGSSSAAMGAAAGAAVMAAPAMAAGATGVVAKYGAMELTQVNNDLKSAGTAYQNYVNPQGMLKNPPSSSSIK